MFVVPPRTSSTRQPTGECAVEKTELRDKQQQQLTERWAGRVEINKKKKMKTHRWCAPVGCCCCCLTDILGVLFKYGYASCF